MRTNASQVECGMFPTKVTVGTCAFVFRVLPHYQPLLQQPDRNKTTDDDNLTQLSRTATVS
jgi:hypothetical protein